jgi:4-amino-4-deoxy-L-arabinose transferase-like glycosyltransferase
MSGTPTAGLAQPSGNRLKLIWIVLTVILALAGMAAVTYQTQSGPGVSGDSVYYVMGAQNLLSGNGYSRYSGGWEPVPITGFPPIFSLILAGAGLFTSDLFNAARVINILLFGLNIFLVGFLTLRFTRNIVAALIASALVTASSSMIHYHAWVMTEGLFIFLTLISLYTLVIYFETSKLYLLVISALLMAASILTRYVGLTSVAMAGLGILLLSRFSWKKRLLHLVVLAVISLVPFILWLYRNSAVSHTLVNRQLVVHLMSAELVRGFISEAVSWFSPRILHLPYVFDGLLFIIFALLIPLLYLINEIKRGILRKSTPWEKFEIMPLLIIFFIPCYVILLVANTTLLDASTSLSATQRYLLPVFVMMVILLVCSVYRLVENRGPGLKITSLVVGLVFIGFFISGAWSDLRNPNKNLGYTDMKHAWTDVVNALDSIDNSHLFISDNVELFYFLAGRPAYAFPISFDDYTQQARQDYAQQIARAKTNLENGAIIVLFRPDAERENVLQQLGVDTMYQFPQAVFYQNSGQ